MLDATDLEFIARCLAFGPCELFEVAERLAGTVARFWRGIGDLAMRACERGDTS
jgi:hypothetical protein